ncbi:unnamed protein product [Allacma fusca]|uniref:Uncharacterized protein n=1 Tax=Allacma fusca TaxID=39272 RepID=A0A8J2LVP3_9HEXA|nr:unnamed protein product [Allacma fusca]
MNFIITCVFIVTIIFPPCSQATEYTARLQPELDAIDVDSYLKNERFFNLQMKCILFEGPCDSVGRWLKPRVAPALLGDCFKCTQKQAKSMDKILEYIQDTRPDLYRAAIAKYLQNSGIQVSQEDVKKVELARESVSNI